MALGSSTPLSDLREPSSRATSADPNRRRESWKEIAAHLGRDVTTVRRWEKREALPVHRHVHDKLASVYAYPAELERWAGDENRRAATPARWWWTYRWWLIASALALVATLTVWRALGPTWFGRTGGVAASGAFNPEVAQVEIVALTEHGRVEDAYERAAAARAAMPQSPVTASAAAYALTYAGQLDAAVRAIEDALAADSDYIRQNSWWTPTALLYQRRFDRFLQVIEGIDSPSFRLYRALAEVERGQPAQAIAHLTGIGESGTNVFNGLAQALHAGLTGRGDHARAIVGSIAKRRRSADDRDGEVTFKQAQILSLAG
jgi:tetratricopeptide (TPR) repeat protein